jgi:hypothetical protein
VQAVVAAAVGVDVEGAVGVAGLAVLEGDVDVVELPPQALRRAAGTRSRAHTWRRRRVVGERISMARYPDRTVRGSSMSRRTPGSLALGSPLR